LISHQEHRKINLEIVAANYHYAGFGPGTANIFRKMLDLSEVTWNDIMIPNTGKIYPVTQSKLVYQIFEIK
jgi:hypothetical protein